MYFNLYPAKEVQLFPGLGIYSGIFVTYLQCRSSRTANIVFYALCLLYILSAAAAITDLLNTLLVSNNFISENIIFLSVMQLYGLNTLPVQLDLQSMLFRIVIVQNVLFGCCIAIGQSILVSTNHCTLSVLFT